jgi:hypothetical protein
LSRDWSFDLALFNSAYPGLDPFSLTVGKFLRWLQLAPIVGAYLSGNLKANMLDDLKFDEIDRTLEIKLKYKV